MRKPYYVHGGLQDNGCWVGPSANHSEGGIRFNWSTPMLLSPHDPKSLRHPGRDRQAGGEPDRRGQGGDAPSGVELARPG